MIKVSKNYASATIGDTYTIPKLNVSFDWSWMIDREDFQSNLKNGNTIKIYFYFKSNKAFDIDKTYTMHIGPGPWYDVGSFIYPKNTTDLILFELDFDINKVVDGYNPSRIFIRFSKGRDDFDVITIKHFYLGIGNSNTPNLPRKNEVKAENQAIFPIEGGYHEVFPI